MNFYTDPSFFIIAGIVCLPAVVLNYLEKPAKGYGLCASLILLVLLLAQTPLEACSLIIFIVLDLLLTYSTLKLFKMQRKHAIALYRCALALCIVPLAIVKITAVFELSIYGFIGISYITFKAVQVLIEIRDGLIKDVNVIDLLYFLLFFPVFTSGPIMRSREFVKQIGAPLHRSTYLDLASNGLVWLIKGLVYSFVLASFFQWLMWFAPSALTGTAIHEKVLAELAYTFSYGLWLFFNFAGYSLMAMGFGAFLGIKVPWNFKSPFRSIDIKDFWNRWHITLSFWLRDYVFMRIVKSFIKHKTFKSRTTTACIGFIANMTLMGIWHGLTIDNVVYGFYHGLLLAGCELFQKKSKLYKRYKKKRWFKLCSWAITMIAVFFGFALFNGQVYNLIVGMR